MTSDQHENPQPDLSIVITCFNEEEILANTVNRLVKGFRPTGVALELVVVDNGSVDGTGQVIDDLIRQGLPVVKAVVEVNEGYGKGALCGLRSCRGRFIGFSTADGQVDAADVVKVYEIASGAKTPCLVKVRRRFRMDGLVRKMVSTIYNLGTTVMFGNLGSIDINGNPKILPSDYIRRMNLQSRDWFLDAEIMIKAKRLRLGVIEFNVLGQMREGGVSHVHAGTCWEFVKNLLRYRLGGCDVLPSPPQVPATEGQPTRGRPISN